MDAQYNATANESTPSEQSTPKPARNWRSRLEALEAYGLLRGKDFSQQEFVTSQEIAKAIQTEWVNDQLSLVFGLREHLKRHDKEVDDGSGIFNNRPVVHALIDTLEQKLEVLEFA